MQIIKNFKAMQVKYVSVNFTQCALNLKKKNLIYHKLMPFRFSFTNEFLQELIGTFFSEILD